MRTRTRTRTRNVVVDDRVNYYYPMRVELGRSNNYKQFVGVVPLLLFCVALAVDTSISTTNSSDSGGVRREASHKSQSEEWSDTLWVYLFLFLLFLRSCCTRDSFSLGGPLPLLSSSYFCWSWWYRPELSFVYHACTTTTTTKKSKKDAAGTNES
mmetsp:Transcript_29946/g.32219  ORF Transcript_29946/g.32219 Transcript_29946/m.32219 type:complete len:155 (+) Transcript_29946:95-559(+)